MQANSRPPFLNAHAASNIRINPKMARIYVYGIVFPCFNDLNFRRSLYHSYIPARKVAVERVLAELERRAEEGVPTGINDEYERAKRDRIILYGSTEDRRASTDRNCASTPEPNPRAVRLRRNRRDLT